MSSILTRLIPRQRDRADAKECESMARLEKAEKDLGELQQRAHAAVTVLNDRAKRNHWRESIEQMIQGAG